MAVLGFLGAGHMGGAIARALASRGVMPAPSIVACDHGSGRAAALAAACGTRVASPAQIVREADAVVIAIRPQDLAGALDALRAELSEAEMARPLWISLAAGRTIDWLVSHIAPNARVVRAMPNLGVDVGLGMTGCAAGATATAEDRAFVERALGAVGRVRFVEECHMDAVTALSGSGPAFFAEALRAMAAGGEALGLPADAARELALQTMLGTATILSQPNAPAVEPFIAAVASKGGTTAAGKAALDASNAAAGFAAALRAARDRSAELSRM